MRQGSKAQTLANGYQSIDRLPIVYNPISRRMFIRGFGASLAIPFLSSLIPKAQAAEGDPLFVFAQSTHGRWQGAWIPDNLPLSTVGMNTRAMSLSSIEGSLGRILGSQLDAVRRKINIIQGLDFVSMTGHDNHPYTASQRNHKSDSDPKNQTPLFPYTIDTILSESNKIYKTPARLPILRLNPRGGGRSFSINGLNNFGVANYLPSYGNSLLETYNVLKPHLGGQSGSSPALSANLLQKKHLVDQVFSQYKAIVSATQLSSVEKASLENYTAHLQKTQDQITKEIPNETPAPQACSSPNFEETTNNDLFNQRLIDMMVIALSCGITRIATYDLNWEACAASAGTVDYHTASGVHEAGSTAGFDNVANWNSRMVKHWAYMVQQMDRFQLLDRAIMVYANDMSSSVPNHHGADLPILTAGSLGGKIRTGEFISYFNMGHKLSNPVPGIVQSLNGNRNNNGSVQLYGGRRWNELLVSILVAAGLGPADYQKGSQGFGRSSCETIPENLTQCGVGASDTRIHYAMNQYYKTVYKEPLNSTLPYFYKG